MERTGGLPVDPHGGPRPERTEIPVIKRTGGLPVDPHGGPRAEGTEIPVIGMIRTTETSAGCVMAKERAGPERGRWDASSGKAPCQCYHKDQYDQAWHMCCGCAVIAVIL